MADERRDRGERRRQRPSVELTNTPFALAADDAYSTTLRAFARGDWEGEIPEAIFYVDGERLGRAIPVQDRYATKAITGLGPGHHYLAEVAIGGQRSERLLMIPELPKRKTAEEVALERKKLALERAKIAAELAKLQKRPDSNEKKLAAARLRLELARIEAELKKLDVAPSEAERNVADARLKLELARIDADIKKLTATPSDAERNLAEERLKLEHARITAELEKLGAQPNPLETELAETRLQRDLTKIKQELAEIGKRPERPPKTLSVERISLKPNPQFGISLTAADGRGTAGVVEAICLGYGMDRIEVDESGSAIWPSTPIDFPEKMRRYRFRIAGADSANKEATKECVAF